MKRGWLLIAAIVVAALQIGFLSWSIAGRANVLRDGQEALVKVEPVDPRDLLRGDFVRLTYGFSRIPASLFGALPAERPDVGERPVWVVLRRDGDGLFGPVAAAFDRGGLKDVQADDLVVRGTTSGWPVEGGFVSADFGVERFYLPEGEGKQIEQDMRERPFFVVLAVAEDGTAQIKAFRDGERTLFEEPLY